MDSDLESSDYENRFKECEGRYDAIFNLTSAPSKIIDSNLTILKVNDALTELLGYSQEELVGTKILEYACDEDKPHWHDLQDAMWHKSKPNFKLDACIFKKDGTLVWFHITTIAFQENGISYAYTILDDFTAWKKLEESERRLSMALKYSKMAVWELDLTDRSITRSDGFDQLFGYEAGQKDWDEASLLAMFLPEDTEELKDLLSKIGPNENLDFRGSIRTKDGVVKWINLNGRAEKTPEGRQRVLGTLYDITRDKISEREKDDFISIASHELKTPLTALKIYLQVLERMKDAPTPKLPVLLEQASKSMSRVTTLVDDLLNASRITGGQLEMKKTRFNLSKAIDECCLHITVAGTYQILAEGEKNVEVEADSERIQRVIVNFVNNAVKYAAASKDIIIQVDREPGHIKVSVIDKGPGIPQEKIEHLFKRYYRTDQTGGQYSGLGLGLYISAEIIKKHGGKIGVDSEPYRGSAFWFTLPDVS
jgi:PAS domain S-box-containing protein